MITHDALAALDRAILRLEEELTREPDPLRQASFVAGALRASWPGSRLSACLLRGGGGHRLATLDAKGGPDAESLARLDVGDAAEGPEAWTRYLTPLGRSVLVSSDHALLGIVLGPGAGDADEGIARLGLSSLSQVFTRHALLRRRLELERENEALEHLASVGELAGVLAHEFSDFLNMLLLHVAVLEYRLPESERADLAELRRHGNRASELVNQFQQYRRAQPPGDSRVDLEEVARDAVARLVREMDETTNGVRVRLEGAGTAPPVRGAAADVRRLTRFLVANAVRATARDGGEVVVAVEGQGEAVRLRVDDGGPAATESQLGQLFSPASKREGVEPLEMAACRSLARRLRGRLSAESRPEGGVRVVMEFEPGGRSGL
ncbi:MAG: HAMP domain-containing sensor histidine kinase [Gemmataceae bacterium]